MDIVEQYCHKIILKYIVKLLKKIAEKIKISYYEIKNYTMHVI